MGCFRFLLACAVLPRDRRLFGLTSHRTPLKPADQIHAQSRSGDRH